MGDELKLCGLRIVQVLLLTSLVCWSTASVATNFLTWDAETDIVTLDSGTDTCNFRSASLVTAEKHTGLRSMRVTFDNVQFGRGCLDIKQKNFSHQANDGSSLYMRWLMKIDPGFSWGGNDRKMKASRSKRVDEGSPSYFTGYLREAGARPLAGCTRCKPDSLFPGDDGPTLSYDFNPATNPDVTNWQEYVVQYRWSNGSNFDGEMRLYVNGALQDSVTGWGMQSFGGASGNMALTFSRGYMMTPYPQFN